MKYLLFLFLTSYITYSQIKFDIKGLIVYTGCWKKYQNNTDMLDKLIDSYVKAYPNLKVHVKNYPTPQYLLSILVMGQDEYGMGDVGEEKDSRDRT